MHNLIIIKFIKISLEKSEFITEIKGLKNVLAILEQLLCLI